jgi:hypothetical protein
VFWQASNKSEKQKIGNRSPHVNCPCRTIIPSKNLEPICTGRKARRQVLWFLSGYSLLRFRELRADAERATEIGESHGQKRKMGAKYIDSEEQACYFSNGAEFLSEKNPFGW